MKEAAITGFGDSDGDGLTLVFASTAAFRVGDIIRFTSSVGLSKTELVKVTAINSATQITVSRDYASTTGVTLIVGDKAIVSSRPHAEGYTIAGGNPTRPTTGFNHMQIFGDDVILTGTDIQVESLGFSEIGKKLNREVERLIYSMQSEINDAAIYGEMVARSSSDPKGAMGGILSLIRGGNVTAVGGSLTQALINDQFEKIAQAGGQSEELVILCNSNQARKMTGFVTTGSAMGPIAPDATGGSIKKFYSDIAGVNFGGEIVMDHRFPKDQVAILDMSKIELRSLRNRGVQDSDATDPKEDAVRRKVMAELSLEVRNADTCHALLTGVSV